MGVPTARPIGRRSLCLGSGAALAILLAAPAANPTPPPMHSPKRAKAIGTAMTDEERAQLQEAYKSTMSGG